MKLAAAEAIAGLVSEDQLCDEFIMPEAFDPRVAEVVSEAVKSHINDDLGRQTVSFFRL